ncbi:MAG: hypothetical protein WC391_02480 [Methanoregula sp.]|jgi:hypothetical protein
MKKKIGVICLLLLLLVITAVQADTSSTSSSTSSSSTSSVDAAALVYVTNVTLDPEVFYPYETGLVKITLKNDGTTAVGLQDADILSDKVHIVKKDNWNTMTYIGAGATLTYSFQIKVDPPDGNIFALFTVATKDAGSIHYPFVVKVDSKDLSATSSGKLDAFTPSTEETVNISIVNPREGAIKNIMIVPSGEYATINPPQTYISSIASGSEIDVPFIVVADQETNLTFHISYQNGDTMHNADVYYPVKFSEDKEEAVPIVNNVVLSSVGTYYELTGDITNTGITDAKGLVVSVGSPAKGVGTYPEYAIGSMAADDSGSFDVTFTCTDLSAVPLVITWRSSTGDTYSLTKTLDLASSSGSSTGTSSGSSNKSGTASSSSMSAGGPPDMGGMGGPGSTSTNLFSVKGGGISSFYPLIAGGIIIVVGIVLWKKRKWLKAKIKKQQ